MFSEIEKAELAEDENRKVPLSIQEGQSQSLAG
jgi:hypothetical protein